MATKQNDPRAAHIVHVFPDATNVKFNHRGMVISLAADGQDTLVFDTNGNTVWEGRCTSAMQVKNAVEWIDATLA